MKKLILIIAFFVIQIAVAQEVVTEKDNNLYNESGVEFAPEYPGGIQAFYKFIANNFYTPASKDFKGGKIYVQFVIEKDGSLVDFKVLRDAGFGTGKEAIRVLKLCEKWKAAMQNGKLVRCSYVLPISLQSN
jgi:periplasmic protein TonB